MIILKELYLENWRSWKCLHLKNLDNIGLCLIQGSNGVGKSSVRQAIEYLLLDKTSDNLDLSELSYNKEGNCEINCVLERNEDVIEITKYRDHSEFDNKTILSINGNTSLTHTDRRETQKEILKLLDIDRNSLFVSTIFSQYSSSFPEAKEKERKDILYTFLSLEKYERWYEIAKEKFKSFQRNIKEYRNIIENAQENAKDTKQSIAGIAAKLDVYENERKRKVEELFQLGESLEAQDTKGLEKEIEKLVENLTNIEEKDFNRFEKLTIFLKKVEKKWNRFKTELRFLVREIRKTENCKCPILDEDCKLLLKRKDSVQKRHSKRLSTLNRRIEVLNKTKDRINIAISDFKAKEVFNNKLENKIKELINKEERIKAENRRIEERKKEIESRIRETKGEENPYVELKKELKNKIKKYKDTIFDYETKTKEIVEEGKYYEFWVKGLSKEGIPNLKIESILGEIEARINQNLSEVFPLAIVDLKAQDKIKSGEIRERIFYKISHPEKAISDYSSYSGGQRQRIRVADLFAFSELLNKFNFLFLDEILELSLDQEGIDQIISLLKKKSSEIGTIFVVSHNLQVQDKFNKIFKIKMEDGVSKLM